MPEHIGDRGAGIGVSRQPVGASDFAVGRHYSYADILAGETDHDPRRFTVAAEILPCCAR